MESLNSEIIQCNELENGTLHQYDNGLIHFKKHLDTRESTPEGTQLLYNSIVKIQKDNKTPILIDLSGMKNMDIDCRSFLINQLPNFASSIAFIIDKEPVIRSQFALTNHISKKTIPIKFFHNEKEALAWLMEHAKI